MTAALQLVPVFAGVVAGHLLVRTGVATREHGRFLFVFAFYVCVPALVFDAFFDAELSWEMAALPLAALLAIVGGYVAGLLVAIAIRSNPDQRHGSVVWSKLFASPPLYGLAAGLVANVADLHPSDTLLRLVDAFGAPTSFLVTIGIGMLLVIERSEMRISVWAIATRLCTSLLIGLALIAVFGLTGMERAVLLTLCVAPVGFNTVTFASLENLDLRLATGTTSLSLAAGLVLVPAMLLLVA